MEVGRRVGGQYGGGCQRSPCGCVCGICVDVVN